MSRSIARSVPVAMSLFPCSGTVVWHLPHGETKRTCDPFWRTFLQPRASSLRTTSFPVTSST